MIRSSFIFTENHVCTEEKDNPSNKVVIVDEEKNAGYKTSDES